MYKTILTSTILLTMFTQIGCGKTEQGKKEEAAKEAIEELRAVFPGAVEMAENAAEQSKWIESNGITIDDYTRIRSQWEIRTGFAGFDPSADFWAIAKDTTPIELESRFPPLTDREWFAASIDLSGRGSAREFKRDRWSSDSPSYTLRFQVALRTIPGKPIKSVDGDLQIKNENGEVLYHEPIHHVPDVSFQDRTWLFMTIDYNDDNSIHRSLRFDDTLHAHFGVSSVTYADGSVQQF